MDRVRSSLLCTDTILLQLNNFFHCDWMNFTSQMETVVVITFLSSSFLHFIFCFFFLVFFLVRQECFWIFEYAIVCFFSFISHFLLFLTFDTHTHVLWCTSFDYVVVISCSFFSWNFRNVIWKRHIPPKHTRTHTHMHCVIRWELNQLV